MFQEHHMESEKLQGQMVCSMDAASDPREVIPKHCECEPLYDIWPEGHVYLEIHTKLDISKSCTVNIILKTFSSKEKINDRFLKRQL